MKTLNFLLCILLVGLGILLLNRQNTDPARPAYFLPADTLVYIDQRHGQELAEVFLRSKLGRVLSRLDYPALLSELGFGAKEMGGIAKAAQLIQLSRASDLVTQLFGKRVVVALFDRRSWYDESEGVDGYIQKHLLVVCRPQHDDVSLDTLLSQHFPALERTVVVYGGHRVFRLVMPNDQPVLLSLAGGQLLLAFEERVIREALDTYENASLSLWHTGEFQQVIKEMQGADRLLLCRVKRLQTLAKNTAAFLPKADERALVYGLTAFPGIESVGYGGWRQAKLIRHKVFVQLDQEAIDGRIEAMVATTPTLNFSLPFVSRDALLYYWSNSLELKILWEMYLERVGGDSTQAKEIAESVKSVFGEGIQEVMAMIGSNIAIIIQDGVIDRFVPIPDFAVFIRLEDSEGVRTAIQHALRHFDIQMQKGNYRHVEYYAWGVDPNESIQPVYTLYRDYLIVSNTLDVLKKVLDTPVSNTRLAGSRTFREIDPGFQTLNNSVCYIDQVKMFSRLQELVSWAGTMLAIQDRQAAEKTKLLLDHLVDPLFWGLSMYEKSATRTYVNNTRIYIESNIRVSN